MIYQIEGEMKEYMGEYYCAKTDSEDYLCTRLEWFGSRGKVVYVHCDKHGSNIDGSYEEFPYGLIVSDEGVDELEESSGVMKEAEDKREYEDEEAIWERRRENVKREQEELMKEVEEENMGWRAVDSDYGDRDEYRW